MKRQKESCSLEKSKAIFQYFSMQKLQREQGVNHSGNMKLSSTKNGGTGVNVYIKSIFPLFRDEEMH